MGGSRSCFYQALNIRDSASGFVGDQMASPEKEIIQGKADIEPGVDERINFLTARALGFGSQVLQRGNNILDLVVIELLFAIVGQEQIAIRRPGHRKILPAARRAKTSGRLWPCLSLRGHCAVACGRPEWR